MVSIMVALGKRPPGLTILISNMRDNHSGLVNMTLKLDKMACSIMLIFNGV